MTVPTMIDPGAWLGKYLEADDVDTDLPRAMLKAFAEALMSAQASMQCRAGLGERSDERTNSRNGYRHRPWDTRVGSIDLAVPKLRAGVYSPEFLLRPRRRAEQALVAVVCQAYVEGVSTRRVDDLVKALWASRGSAAPRCLAWRPSSTPRSPSSATVPSTADLTSTCGSTA